MVETLFLPMDIQEESTMEFEKEDDINEYGSYFMNISSNPCSYEKSPESIGLSNIATHKIFNPLDEDMTPMHMTIFGTWYGGVGGHQGCPSQEGGPRLIRLVPEVKAQSNSSSSLPRPPGPVFLKLVT